MPGVQVQGLGDQVQYTKEVTDRAIPAGLRDAVVPEVYVEIDAL